MIKNLNRGILLFLFSLLFISCQQSRLEKLLIQEQIPLSFKGKFEIINDSQDPFYLFAKDVNEKNVFIKLRWYSIKNKQQGIDQMNNLLTTMFSQFHFTPAAYPGRENEAEKCRESFRPRIFKWNHGSFVSSFVDNRFALCICQANVLAYKKVSAFFLDKNQNHLLAIDYFVSRSAQLKDLQNFFDQYFTKFTPLIIEEIKS